MANTYTQIHVQTVFSVKFRNAVIIPEIQQEVFGYMGQLINDFGHKTLIVNGMPDHVHCFFGLNPKQSIADLMRDLKANSSRWINAQKYFKHRFEWQAGYGGFSYSKSQVDDVVKYIKQQQQHHKKMTFKQEYLAFLAKFDIEHEETYTFHDPI